MFDKIVKKHKNIYNFFKLYMPEYMYPNFADEKTTVPMCIPLLNSKFTIEFKNKILEHGIFCRKYYQPLENTSNSIDTYNKILSKFIAPTIGDKFYQSVSTQNS